MKNKPMDEIQPHEFEEWMRNRTSLLPIFGRVADLIQSQADEIERMRELVRLGYIDGYTDGELNEQFKSQSAHLPRVQHRTIEQDWLDSVTFDAINPKDKP